jgi:polar amino acid transport system substrate-binding protein
LTDGIIFVDDPEYPPVASLDSGGQQVGWAPDFDAAIGKVLGVKVVVQQAKFAATLTGVQAGRYDSAPANDTPDRQKTFDFVDFLTGGSDLLVKAGNPDGLDINGLCGKTVAVAQGTEQAVQVLPGLSSTCTTAGKAAIQVSQFPDENTAQLALTSGHVQAVIGDTGTLAYVALQSPSQFEVTSNPIVEGFEGFMFRKGDPLVSIVAQAIDSLISDGTYATILKKWNYYGTLALPKAEINGQAG